MIRVWLSILLLLFCFSNTVFAEKGVSEKLYKLLGKENVEVLKVYSDISKDAKAVLLKYKGNVKLAWIVGEYVIFGNIFNKNNENLNSIFISQYYSDIKEAQGLKEIPPDVLYNTFISKHKNTKLNLKKIEDYLSKFYSVSLTPRSFKKFYVFLDLDCEPCQEFYREVSKNLSYFIDNKIEVLIYPIVLENSYSYKIGSIILSAKDSEEAKKYLDLWVKDKDYFIKQEVIENNVKKITLNLWLFAKLNLEGTPLIIYRDKTQGLHLHTGKLNQKDLIKVIESM